MQKFSSNVIEKCMDRASEEMIVKYVHELADPAAMRPLLQVFHAQAGTHTHTHTHRLWLGEAGLQLAFSFGG